MNADGILGANEDIFSYNLYIYVSNNPVNNTDFSGKGFIVGFLRTVITVQHKIGKAKQKISDAMRHTAKSIVNFFGGLIDKVKENFVFEVGKGVGGSLSPIESQKFTGTSRDNRKCIGRDDSFECNHTTTRSFGIGGFSFDNEISYETECWSQHQIGETQSTWSFNLPILSIDSAVGFFVGINIDIDFIISAHLKIGWDMK